MHLDLVLAIYRNFVMEISMENKNFLLWSIVFKFECTALVPQNLAPCIYFSKSLVKWPQFILTTGCSQQNLQKFVLQNIKSNNYVTL